ncbi:MAG TPA: RES domain-containing protein [Candidatus Tumulicola sp.]|jgi:RES domain-containing protein
MKSLRRSGIYFRVFKPGWGDPLDPAYSKSSGGRWNAPGAFGAIYLCATLEVAAANARARHAGRAIRLFDLLPSRRPSLLEVRIPDGEMLDVVSEEGVRAAGLPRGYPYGVPHERCQSVGRRAYALSELRGIACRSAAEATPGAWAGEELAWFDRSPVLREHGPRRTFAQWYPHPFPR